MGKIPSEGNGSDCENPTCKTITEIFQKTMMESMKKGGSGSGATGGEGTAADTNSTKEAKVGIGRKPILLTDCATAAARSNANPFTQVAF